ncbi:MAG TPA: amidophosphoribosyltransferase [Candidatus Evtepia faecavium]|nr:amidophosphoribosyltransferase [Evtepia sp.]HIY33147.1 amidophosphoribosyltransferase [Candidatus Evtepia faecavium]
MGGFCGAISNRDVVLDVYFGTDYHSHLGTRRGGMAAWDPELGFQREIHNIENAPFRTKFDKTVGEMVGKRCIGSISDTDPQPLLVRSVHGTYAICVVGVIKNEDQLIQQLLSDADGHFEAMSGGRVNSNELVATLISQRPTIAEGIRYAQNVVEGTVSVLIMTPDCLIAGRDKFGRLPIHIGQDEEGCCVAFESFAYQKMGYHDAYELGPAEVVKITESGWETLLPPEKEMRICAFLWTYYGYPNSNYEGVNVEVMRNRNGALLAKTDREEGTAQDIDYVSGVPDSGTPHAIGYANESGIPFARPFIKYTPTWPRSFMPTNQKERDRVAKMKQIPVHELIEGKKLLFVDDSIVRGTQLRETVEFLYANGAKEVHIRSACPPIMYGCKFLNFSTSRSPMELIARRTVYELEGEEGDKHLEEYSDPSTERGRKLREAICEKLHFTSLGYQSLDKLLQAIGLDPCKVCTYCWNGKE